jgi:hypothetical protein
MSLSSFSKTGTSIVYGYCFIIAPTPSLLVKDVISHFLLEVKADTVATIQSPF